MLSDDEAMKKGRELEEVITLLPVRSSCTIQYELYVHCMYSMYTVP